MNFGARGGRGRAAAAIDITALIDVVFLLLIFLLVTTTFRKDEYAFRIDLPTSSTQHVEVTTDKTTVFITKDGSLHLLVVPADAAPEAAAQVAAEKVSTEELDKRLRELFKTRPDASISIRGEQETSYQSMIDVVALMQDIGFRNIWFPYEADKQ